MMMWKVGRRSSKPMIVCLIHCDDIYTMYWGRKVFQVLCPMVMNIYSRTLSVLEIILSY